MAKEILKPLCPDQIHISHVYRAKNPKEVGSPLGQTYVNDRVVVWRNHIMVQYDSPGIRNGAQLPAITLAKFLLWAGKNVTLDMPKDSWVKWEDYAP